MKKPRILAAVAASALALPIISTAPSPAHAATTRQLMVEVINRSGDAAARADVQLLNVATGTNIDMGTGRHRQLRPGRYNVAAWIITGSGASQTYTLADQILDMNASKTVVLDARKGHRSGLARTTQPPRRPGQPARSCPPASTACGSSWPRAQDRRPACPCRSMGCSCSRPASAGGIRRPVAA